MQKFDVDQLCPKGQQCDDINCSSTKLHPRCFTGICIQGLQEDEMNGRCSDQSCQKYHFSSQMYGMACITKPINGIYPFNLCKNPACINDKNCGFLHPEWSKKYCVANLNYPCRIKQHQNHITWEQLREEVYKQNKQKLKFDWNPEQGSKEDEEFLRKKNICIENLRGLCPQKLCAKQHIIWEEYNTLDYQFVQQLHSCKLQNKKQYYDQIQSLQQKPLLMSAQELQRIKEQVQNENLIDLVFIMDMTGSMKPWVDVCKSQIKDALDSFKQSVESTTLRFGFVCYRDEGDKEKIDFFDISQDMYNLINFIQKKEARGGGDTAEDLFCGIQKASELNISKHPNSILITMLFTDAPCHGKQYYELGITDKQADQIAQGTLENLMKNYRKLKKNNYFTCVSINNRTDKMFKIMKENFNGLHITQLSKQDSFKELVKFTLRNSFEVTQKYFKTNQYKVEFQKPKYRDDYSPNIKLEFWSNFDETLKFNYLRSGETVLEVIEEPKEKGKCSITQRFFDVRNNANVVLKIPIELLEANAQPPSDSENQVQSRLAEKRFFNQAKARELAKIYRERTKDIPGAPPIFFPLPILYTFPNKFHGLSTVYGEIYIDIETQWHKYTTNIQFADKSHSYFQSFSHFILEETNLFTMTDLQGKENLITDPAIQTSDEQKSTIDQCNLEKLGIGKFLFGQHNKCSFICDKLELGNYADSKNLDQTQWKSQRLDQKFYAFCEICEDQILLTQNDYQNGLHKKCKSCQDRQIYLQDFWCQCCKEIFRLPTNEVILVGTQIGKCDKCKLECKSGSGVIPNRCFYCKISCNWNVSKKQINNQEVYLCRKGYQYLQSIRCQKCEQSYNFKINLSDEQYEKGIYICINCS